MDYILTNHAVPKDTLGLIEKASGSVLEPLTLSQLRTMPTRDMLARLRSLKGSRIFVFASDSNSQSLLPVLRILASYTPVRSVFLVGEDLRLQPVSRWTVAPDAASVAWATCVGEWRTRGASAEIRRLLREPRQKVTSNGMRDVMYLYSNIWLGVKVGGSVGHIAGVIDGFLEHDYRVEYVSLMERGIVNPRADYMPLRVPPVMGIRPHGNCYACQESVVRQLRETNHRKHGFIYHRLFLNNYSGVEVARERGLPLVIEYNGSESWAQKHWGRAVADHDLATAAEAVCLRHAHLVVTVSNVLRDELIERGVEKDRIVYYPNCIDPARFDPARHEAAATATRAELGMPPGSTVVTFVGTFGKWHGVDMLARTIAEMARSDRAWLLKHRVRFVLIGDGLRMPEIKEMLAAAEISPFVTLTGLVPQDEAPRYLAASDILMSPHVRNPDGSRFFGSPTKLFEYMAMGKGIVASDLDQIGEVLRPAVFAGGEEKVPDGACAVLCEPGNVTDIIKGIRLLTESPELRAELGANARRKVLGNFTWSRHVAAILNGFERVMAS